MISFQYAWEGASPRVLAARFLAVERSLGDKRTPLRRCVTEVMIPSIALNFAVGGRPGWEPLAAGTVERRRSAGLDGPILHRTGALEAAMARTDTWTITRNEARIDSLPDSVAYGIAHQTGASKGNWFMPARPFAVVQPEDEDRMADIFADWALETVLARI